MPSLPSAHYLSGYDLCQDCYLLDTYQYTHVERVKSEILLCRVAHNDCVEAPPPAALSPPMQSAAESAWHSRRLLGPAEPSWSPVLHADCYNTFNTVLPLPSTCPKHASYFHASGLDPLLRMSFPPALKALERLSYFRPLV